MRQRRITRKSLAFSSNFFLNGFSMFLSDCLLFFVTFSLENHFYTSTQVNGLCPLYASKSFCSRVETKLSKAAHTSVYIHILSRYPTVRDMPCTDQNQKSCSCGQKKATTICKPKHKVWSGGETVGWGRNQKQRRLVDGSVQDVYELTEQLLKQKLGRSKKTHEKLAQAPPSTFFFA